MAGQGRGLTAGLDRGLDVVILSNGPGEVTTWVKPVVRALRLQRPDPADLRISVVLSPCPNATGQEGAIARSYPEVDRVQDANAFWPFLLWGKTVAGWDWRDRGVVLFLGGDQLYAVLVGRRLGYRTVIYAEWFANWPRWVDAFGVMGDRLLTQAPAPHRHKFTVVGDLMGDTQGGDHPDLPPIGNGDGPLLGLLPGSKRAKLTQGVPLFTAVADYVAARYPGVRFVIPVAPTITLPDLLAYGDPQQNPYVATFNGPPLTLVRPPSGLPYLQTAQGSQIFLWEAFPAHPALRQCALCLTTVGANTAELGALAVPMVVVLPTHQLDAMNAWDGPLGILVNLPGIGKPLNRWVTRIFLAYVERRGKRFAWPNIWAGREVVPEMLGKLTVPEVGDRALAYLQDPAALGAMVTTLRQVRGPGGAATKLAALVLA